MIDKYRLERIHVTESSPYNNDMLDRKKSGDILHQLVQSHSDGLVMAINGKWGSGKTTFVEMWQQQMKNEGYETIYYNAWENDYVSDPLIGIIAEFKKKITIGGEKQIAKFTNVVRKVSFSMVPSLLALMVKQFTGLSLEDLDKVIKDGSKEAIDLLNKSVDNYIDQQKTIKEFRIALEEYVALFDKPIIFIIDELDRCKPDFAVKTLERIKHLFSVKNIVFVLAIDRNQLGNSIRGYYGSDLIDADDYLRKFIDVQYDLPPGAINIMVRHIFELFGFSSISNGKSSNEFIELQFFVLLVCSEFNLSIRQLEKWILHLRLVINQLSHYDISYETTAFLVFIYIYDTAFYNHLINYDISDQEIIDYIIQLFSHSSVYTESNGFECIYKIMAEILIMKYYDNDIKFQERVMDKNGKLLLELDDAVSEKLTCAIKDNKNHFIPLFSINNLFSDFLP